MSELTAEIIADLRLPDGIQIAPDGTAIAYTLSSFSQAEEHPRSSIWLASVDGASAARQFTRGDAQERQPKWSPDGKQLAFLSDREKAGTALIYLIAIDGGEALPLTSKKQKRGIADFAWSPGGGQIAFTSSDEPSEEDERREKEKDDPQVYGEKWEYARLRLISVATREVSTLVSGDRHVANFAWHPQGHELAYSVRKTPELDAGAQETIIERIPLAGGEPQEVCRFPFGIDELIWSADGEQLLFLANISLAQSSYAVFSVPASGGEPKRIAGGETNCIMSIVSTSEEPVVYLAEGLQSKLCRLHTASGKLTALLPEDESDYISYHARVLADGRTVLAAARSSGQEAHEVWSGSAEKGQLIEAFRPVTQHHKDLSNLTLGTQEAFYWTSSDGWEMDGILIRPPDASHEQPLPMVVLVHGGPYGRSGYKLNASWANWGQWLATAGYVVLMPNPRGGFGHGETFAASVKGDVGGADYQDVMAAVDAAIERGIADPEKLAIGGWSQGGFMSAWAVTQSKRFKAAIMGAGVSDWGMMVVTSDLPHFEMVLGETAPWEGIGPHRHAHLSPISFARNVQTPVLILHGERDERVPLSQGIGFHRALRHYNMPVELVVYPREPHGIRERAHQVDVLKRVRSWYDRWLKA
jgi:dipeptidyl aminopeptidase/acylaminoacyl peptidase